MDAVVLDDIPFELDLSSLAEVLHVKPGSRHADEVRRLAEEAAPIARPKALYKISFVEHCGEDRVEVDSISLTSRILRVNLDKAHRVFPYAATGGIELEAWADSMGDILHRYWADTIAELALRVASQALLTHLGERFQPGPLSAMNPGSLTDWPIEQQRPLFRILGDTDKMIGVRLSSSLLMIPRKSVSGIHFPTDVTFASCQLCPRENCPSRRAPYDPELYKSKYVPS